MHVSSSLCDFKTRVSHNSSAGLLLCAVLIVDASGSVFKSITGRLMSDNVDSNTKLGPGCYNPVNEVKRSYMYNVHSVWV